MSERKFYVICDDDCRFEGMTKEQILTAIQQAVTDGHVSDPDSAVFSKIKETKSESAIQFWVGTEAEFNKLSAALNSDLVMARMDASGNVYLCTDDSTLEGWHDQTVHDAANKTAKVVANKLDKPVLLWENSDPSAKFGSTILSIPGMSRYNAFFISWRRSSSYDFELETWHEAPATGKKECDVDHLSGSGGTWSAWERSFTIDRENETFDFGNGFYSYSGNAYYSSSVMKPLRIYGTIIGGEEQDADEESTEEIVATIDTDGSLKVTQI